MTKAAIYARYSSDSQQPTSIEDQIRTCRQIAEREGWTVVENYTDYEITGTHMIRRGLQNLLADAQAHKFEVVIAESLDRLSRDQEGTAHIYKRMSFEGVRIHTLSEGLVNKLHVAMKGAMNDMFIDELALKTRRGLEGRVLAGKSAGGLSYGYSVVHKIGPDGQPIRGDRVVNEDEAKIVRRIFEDYLVGKSPRKIAHDLNRDGLTGPRGREWAASTINGNRKRGTGILNNENYIGVLVWDRQSFKKDPVTGKRVARPNDPSKAKRVEVPELRIVDQELWDKVKAYQASLDRKGDFGAKRRPPKLFSHLLKCGCCGGGMSTVAKGRYGCSTARNKGTCDNRLTVAEAEIERRVLSALEQRLMDKELCEAFCTEYTARLNRARHAHNAARAANVAELERVERAIKKLIESIKNGVPGELLKDEAIGLHARKEELTGQLDTTEDAPIFVHPNMAHRYSVQIQDLISSLNDPAHRDRAAQVIRKLIERIVFTPNDDKSALTIDLYGDLAGVLLLSTAKMSGNLFNPIGDLNSAQMAEIEQIKGITGGQKANRPPSGDGGQVSMVAGAHTHHYPHPAIVRIAA